MTRRALALPVVALSLVLGGSDAALAAAPVADRDGDGVFDNLETRVRNTPPARAVRVIVTLSRDATRGRVGGLEDDVASLDATRRFSVVDAFTATVDAGRVRELAREPGVVSVEHDAPVFALNAGAQRSFGVAEARLDVPSLDGDRDGLASYSPDDLVAAVIDSGIHTAHVDLDGGKVLAFKDFTGWSSCASAGCAYDDHGHGTHVAGTIAGDGVGDGRGVAPRAGLVGLKVLDYTGNGSLGTIVDAIDWIVKDPDGGGPLRPNGEVYGIEVVNMSIGTHGCSDGTSAQSQAVNAAAAAGYSMVVAAGNDGPFGCTISTMADAADGLTVGAMADNENNGYSMATFSSRGPTLDGRHKPDIVSPGVNINSARTNTTNGYSVKSGTSMAAPFAAGVALLMLDQNPFLTPAEIKQKMMDTAVDWGLPGKDDQHGAGRLDGYAAIAAATTPTPVELTSPPTNLPSYRKVQGTLDGPGSQRFYSITNTSDSNIPLTISLNHAEAGDDFDIYLYNSFGYQVAQADANEPHASVYQTGWGGPYILRVESKEGAGDFYLDVSGATTFAERGPIPPPTNISPPQISGTGAVGATLTRQTGTWQDQDKGDDAPKISYAWQICRSDGRCSYGDSASLEYTVPERAAGMSVRFIETAYNEGGPTTVSSNLIDIAPTKPKVVYPGHSLEGWNRDTGVLWIAEATWVGSQSIELSYAWERCTADGVTCEPVPGTASEYTLGAGDVGFKFRAYVTAENDQGTTTEPTNFSQVIEPIWPVNTAPASITGDPVEGATLTADRGSWTGTEPIEFEYQWLRCDNSVYAINCVPISDGTGTSETYLLGAQDIGARLRVRVTGKNSAGQDVSETPVATATITMAAPQATTDPAVTGDPIDGSALTSTNGTWKSSGTVTYSRTWERCAPDGTGCATVTGATGSQYALRAADVGYRLRSVVKATNAAGATTRTSNLTGVVAALAPSATAAPAVSGSAVEGSTLTGTPGSWSGTSPIDLSLQWLSCDSSGSACTPIERATTRTYTPVAADEGRRLRLQVEASNGGGKATAESPPTAAVSLAPPTNTTAPTLDGPVRDGGTLVATDGTWKSSGPSTIYTYAWERCDAAGADCTTVPGAEASSYTLGPDDVGRKMRVLVTAENSAGQATAPSALTATTVAAVAPAATTLPSISGTALEGSTLTGQAGAWTGTPAIAQRLEWLRCDADGAACAPIAEAMGSTYVLKAADTGRRLRLRVIASNAGGETTEQSEPTAGVQMLPPVSGTEPAIAGDAVEGTELSAGTGTWSSAGPVTHSYVWERCDGDGTGCAPITSAAGDRYALTATDIDHTLRVVVTARNDGGSATRASSTTPVVAARPSPPVEEPPAEEPPVEEPPAEEPPAEEPPVEEPPAKEPPAEQPPVEEPPAEEPPAEQPPATDPPPAEQPPAEQPPAEDPPAEQPPVTDPPAEQPPAEAPPADQPPAEGPPADQPPATDPPAEQPPATDPPAPADPPLAEQPIFADPPLTEPLVVEPPAGEPLVIDAPAEQPAAEPPVAPSNGARPTQSGTAREAGILRVSTGSWRGTTPIALAVQWLRCDPAGARCREIAGATSVQYVLKPADVGHRIRATVRASNVAGSGAARTAASAVVRARQPVSLTRPRVSTSERSAVRADGGTWSATRPVKFGAQWLRCSSAGKRCREIRGAVGSVYVPDADDLGSTLRVRITATNEAGARTVTSRATRVLRSVPTKDAGAAKGRRLVVWFADRADADRSRVSARLARTARRTRG